MVLVTRVKSAYHTLIEMLKHAREWSMQTLSPLAVAKHLRRMSKDSRKLLNDQVYLV